MAPPDLEELGRKRAYQRAHYHANQERWRAKRMRWEAKMRAFILAAKDKPCADCGGRWHPLVREFDHLPGSNKKFNLYSMCARKHGLESLKAEIAKCEVVCPTCHRARALKRLGKLPT